MPVTVTALGAEIGVEIGVEIAGLSGSQLAEQRVADDCQAALNAHGVVIYREANIDDGDLVAVSRMLGDVVVAPMGGDEVYPEISKITLDPTKSVLASYRQGTFFWRIDGATEAVPQKATLPTARDVSDDGGDTEFRQHLRRLRGAATDVASAHAPHDAGRRTGRGLTR